MLASCAAQHRAVIVNVREETAFIRRQSSISQAQRSEHDDRRASECRLSVWLRVILYLYSDGSRLNNEVPEEARVHSCSLRMYYTDAVLCI